MGYLNGTTSKPIDEKAKDVKAMATWNQNNSKVVTWILNSIDSNIALTLQSFYKALDMSNHLRKLYHQTNKARKFYLDTELAKYTQGDTTDQEYYSGFLTYGMKKAPWS